MLLISEEESFMARWRIPLCTRGKVHYLNYDSFAIICGGIFMYKYGFNLVLLQELYWLTACFIFVCRMDASLNPWTSKSYCYYHCFSPSSPSTLRVGNGLCRIMNSFKPGLLCERNLDNAYGVLACVSVSWPMLFDGGCVDDLLPLSMVSDTGVLGCLYLVWGVPRNH